MENIFEELNKINVNNHTENKNGLTYLSWAWAIAEVLKKYPDMRYDIKKFADKDGFLRPYMYDENTGYMVETCVTIGDITRCMWLPVMDNNNHAMKSTRYEIATKYKTIVVEPATMFDVNKTIMRCLTKNLAMFGLGLYIYAGEDLPEEPQQKDVFEKEVIAEKARHTKEVNKAVKEYQTSERGLDERFESAMSMLNKMPKVEPTQEALITRINVLLSDLSNAGQNERHDKLKSLIDSKMEEPFKDDDIIFGKEE